MQKKKNLLPKIRLFGLGGMAYGVFNALPLDNLQQLGCLKMTAIDSHPNEIMKLPMDILYPEAYGTGGDIELGKKIFNEIRQEVETRVDESDFIICVAGLGGGTGSSFLQEIVDIAHTKNKTCIVYATSPNIGEQLSRVRMAKFKETVSYIEEKCSYSLLDMVKIQRSSPTSAQAVEQIANEVLGCVNSLVVMMVQAGFDGADLHKAFATKGLMMNGIGTGESIIECIEGSLEKKFNYNWLTTATHCAYALAGDYITPEDEEQVVLGISRYANQNFEIKGKVILNGEKEKRLFVFLTGLAQSYNRKNSKDLLDNRNLLKDIIQTNRNIQTKKDINSTDDLKTYSSDIARLVAGRTRREGYVKLQDYYNLNIAFSTFSKFLSSIEEQIEEVEAETQPVVEITTVYDE